MHRRALVVLLVVLLVPSCARRNRDVGVEPGPFAWTSAQGNARRAGTEREAVSRDPEVAWTVDVGRGLRSQPLVHEGVVVVAGTNRLIAAYSAATGDRFWEQRLNASVGGGVLWRSDTLWVATESLTGEVSARRLGKGGQLWERDVGPARHPPLLIGETLYIGTENGALTSLDAATGERHWRMSTPSGLASAPLAYGDHSVVLVGQRDSAYVVAREDGAIERSIALPDGASAGATLAGDLLLVPLRRGRLAGVNLASGTVWTTDTGHDLLAAPVVAADGTIYALTSAGEVWRVLPGTERAGRIAALGGAARASLTLVRDGLLVGRLDGSLFLLERSGDIVWERNLDGSIVAPVAVANGAVFVPLLDGRLSKLE